MRPFNLYQSPLFSPPIFALNGWKMASLIITNGNPFHTSQMTSFVFRPVVGVCIIYIPKMWRVNFATAAVRLLGFFNFLPLRFATKSYDCVTRKYEGKKYMTICCWAKPALLLRPLKSCDTQCSEAKNIPLCTTHQVCFTSNRFDDVIHC